MSSQDPSHSSAGQHPSGQQPSGQHPSGEYVASLRALITQARAMPMSSSCVINRADALALLDAVERALPAELDQARGVIGDADGHLEQARQQAEQIIVQAQRRAVELADAEHVSVLARQRAEQTLQEARADADGLQAETDGFIDARMASFESVLHKTISQVALARERLSRRSGLDDPEPTPPAPASGPPMS